MGKFITNRKAVFAGFFIVVLLIEAVLLAFYGAFDEIFRTGSALYLAFIATVMSAVLTGVWMHLVRSADPGPRHKAGRNPLR